jgi:hypothetical protein
MPAETMPGVSPPRRALAVAVGLFASWQLVFLPAANLIHFVPLRPADSENGPGAAQYQKVGRFTSAEPLQRAADGAGTVLDFWSGASGQEQGWSLFAPGTPPYSVFLAAEFHFADGTSEAVRSEFEPADRRNPPPRAPLLTNRPFNNEEQLIYAVLFLPPEEVAGLYAPPEGVAGLREYYRELPAAARANRAAARAWLAWKAKQFAESHPERGTPTAVVLKHRYIPTPRPGEPADWTRPAAERPFIRWRPADDSLEGYDALGGRFAALEGKP